MGTKYKLQGWRELINSVLGNMIGARGGPEAKVKSGWEKFWELIPFPTM